MFVIDESVLINAPVEAVFEFAADYRNDVHWRPGVVSMEVTGSEPYTVDNQSHEVMRSYGRNIHTKGEVTAVDPNRSITFRSPGGPIPAEGVRSFEKVGDQTKFTYHLEGELDTFYSIIWIFASGTYRRQMAEAVQKLKRVLEDPSLLEDQNA